MVIHQKPKKKHAEDLYVSLYESVSNLYTWGPPLNQQLGYVRNRTQNKPKQVEVPSIREQQSEFRNQVKNELQGELLGNPDTTDNNISFVGVGENCRESLHLPVRGRGIGSSGIGSSSSFGEDQRQNADPISAYPVTLYPGISGPESNSIRATTTSHAGLRVECVGEFHTCFLDSDNNLYTWGMQTEHRPRLGHDGTGCLPERVIFPRSFYADSFSLLSSGSGLMLKDLRERILVGKTSSESESVNGFSFFPHSWNLSSMRRELISKVVCGRDHTVLLTFEGKVWGFGSNEQGQLLRGHNISDNSGAPGGSSNSSNSNSPVLDGHEERTATVETSVTNATSGASSHSNKQPTSGPSIPKAIKRPENLFDNKKVRDIAAGDFYTLVLEKHYGTNGGGKMNQSSGSILQLGKFTESSAPWQSQSSSTVLNEGGGTSKKTTHNKPLHGTHNHKSSGVTAPYIDSIWDNNQPSNIYSIGGIHVAVKPNSLRVWWAGNGYHGSGSHTVLFGKPRLDIIGDDGEEDGSKKRRSSKRGFGSGGNRNTNTTDTGDENNHDVTERMENTNTNTNSASGETEQWRLAKSNAPVHVRDVLIDNSCNSGLNPNSNSSSSNSPRLFVIDTHDRLWYVCLDSSASNHNKGWSMKHLCNNVLSIGAEGIGSNSSEKNELFLVVGLKHGSESGEVYWNRTELVKVSDLIKVYSGGNKNESKIPPKLELIRTAAQVTSIHTSGGIGRVVMRWTKPDHKKFLDAVRITFPPPKPLDYNDHLHLEHHLQSIAIDGSGFDAPFLGDFGNAGAVPAAPASQIYDPYLPNESPGLLESEPQESDPNAGDFLSRHSSQDETDSDDSPTLTNGGNQNNSKKKSNKSNKSKENGARVPSLLELCEKTIMEQVTLSNVVDVLDYSIDFQAARLLNYCLVVLNVNWRFIRDGAMENWGRDGQGEDLECSYVRGLLEEWREKGVLLSVEHQDEENLLGSSSNIDNEGPLIPRGILGGGVGEVNNLTELGRGVVLEREQRELRLGLRMEEREERERDGILNDDDRAIFMNFMQEETEMNERIRRRLEQEKEQEEWNKSMEKDLMTLGLSNVPLDFRFLAFEKSEVLRSLCGDESGGDYFYDGEGNSFAGNGNDAGIAKSNNIMGDCKDEITESVEKKRELYASGDKSITEKQIAKWLGIRIREYRDSEGSVVGTAGTKVSSSGISEKIDGGATTTSTKRRERRKHKKHSIDNKQKNGESMETTVFEMVDLENDMQQQEEQDVPVSPTWADNLRARFERTSPEGEEGWQEVGGAKRSSNSKWVAGSGRNSWSHSNSRGNSVPISTVVSPKRDEPQFSLLDFVVDKKKTSSKHNKRVSVTEGAVTGVNVDPGIEGGQGQSDNHETRFGPGGWVRPESPVLGGTTGNLSEILQEEQNLQKKKRVSQVQSSNSSGHLKVKAEQNSKLPEAVRLADDNGTRNSWGLQAMPENLRAMGGDLKVIETVQKQEKEEEEIAEIEALFAALEVAQRLDAEEEQRGLWGEEKASGSGVGREEDTSGGVEDGRGSKRGGNKGSGKRTSGKSGGKKGSGKSKGYKENSTNKGNGKDSEGRKGRKKGRSSTKEGANTND